MFPKRNDKNKMDFSLIKMPKELMSDDENEDGDGIITESEHLMPYLMRYILSNKLGVLPYQV